MMAITVLLFWLLVSKKFEKNETITTAVDKCFNSYTRCQHLINQGLCKYPTQTTTKK